MREHWPGSSNHRSKSLAPPSGVTCTFLGQECSVLPLIAFALKTPTVSISNVCNQQKKVVDDQKWRSSSKRSGRSPVSGPPPPSHRLANCPCPMFGCKQAKLSWLARFFTTRMERSSAKRSQFRLVESRHALEAICNYCLPISLLRDGDFLAPRSRDSGLCLNLAVLHISSRAGSGSCTNDATPPIALVPAHLRPSAT